jgi:circadian clock protein KaiB
MMDITTVPPPVKYRLTLYITGATARSLRAVENVHRFCEEQLPGQYELEIVDLYRAPERAGAAQIVAAPTLVRSQPSPARYAIGDMSNTANLHAAIKVRA